MQRLTLSVTFAIATCAAVCPARAEISAFWRPIASGNGSVGSLYPAVAITVDPALLGMQTWDLRVTTTGNWSEASLRATLPAGHTFYRRTSTGIVFAEIVTADRAYWTGVGAPTEHQPSEDHNPTNILGGFPDGPVSKGTANGTNTPGVLSVRWGDLVNDVPGNHRIARLTFPLGVMPDVLTADQSATFSFTGQVAPTSSVAIPELPEPASGLVALLVLSFGATRRSRNIH